MCLDRLGDFPVPELVGWKVFRKLGRSHDAVLAPILFRKPDLEFPPNIWISDPVNLLTIGYEGIKYKTGFHIFIDEKEAEQYRIKAAYHFVWFDSSNLVVRKIYFKEVVAKGFQESFLDTWKVIVAKQMFICDE
jgi:hypothetical protein